MLSLRVDSSKYQVLWSDAEGPAVGSWHKNTYKGFADFKEILLCCPTTEIMMSIQAVLLSLFHPFSNSLFRNISKCYCYITWTTGNTYTGDVTPILKKAQLANSMNLFYPPSVHHC